MRPFGKEMWIIRGQTVAETPYGIGEPETSMANGPFQKKQSSKCHFCEHNVNREERPGLESWHKRCEINYIWRPVLPIDVSAAVFFVSVVFWAVDSTKVKDQESYRIFKV